jgi:hypothetical protein
MDFLTLSNTLDPVPCRNGCLVFQMKFISV